MSDLISMESDRVLAQLAAYPQIAAPQYAAAAEGALLILTADMAQYPTQHSTTYHRTGTLGRTWYAAQPEWHYQADQFQASARNPTPYAAFVQGAADQAWMHAGHWRTDQQIMAARRRDIEGRFRTAADTIAHQINEVTA